MAIFDFQGTILLLKDIGIVDFFFPFLLVFAIVYGILDRSQIFGENRHDINAIIAMVIGFIFGITGWAVQATQTFLPWVGVIAIAILSFLILISMFYPNFTDIANNKTLQKYATILIAVILVILFLSMFGVFDMLFSGAEGAIGSGGGSGGGPSFWEELITELITIGVVLGVLFGMVLAITKGSKNKE